MKFSTRLLYIFVALVFVSCATKPVEQYTEDELTQNIMWYSGVSKALMAVPGQINQSMQKRKDSLDEKTFAMVNQTMHESFATEKLYKMAFEDIKNSLTREDKIAVLKWYKNPLGQKIVQLENYVNTPEGVQKFQNYIATLQTQQPEKDDIVFAGKIIQHTNALKIIIDSISAITLGILNGVNGTLPVGKQMSDADMKTLDKNLKKTMATQMAPVVIITTVFAYKDLKPEERQEFLKFLSVGSGGRYTKLVGKTLEKTFYTAGKDSGTSLARNLASLKPEKK